MQCWRKHVGSNSESYFYLETTTTVSQDMMIQARGGSSGGGEKCHILDTVWIESVGFAGGLRRHVGVKSDYSFWFEQLEEQSNLEEGNVSKSRFRWYDQEFNFGHEPGVQQTDMTVLSRWMVLKASTLVEITKGVSIDREKNHGQSLGRRGTIKKVEEWLVK